MPTEATMRLLPILLCACLVALPAGAPAHAADEVVPVGQLPRSVVPQRAALDLRIDAGAKGLEGRVRIDVEVVESTDTVWMHGRDLRIASARFVGADGEAVPLAAEQVDPSGVLRLKSPVALATGAGRIEIEYAADFGQQLEGAYQVKAGGEHYVVTQMEPLGARSAFPGFDEPSFKHPWEISLVVPEDQQGFANTAMVGIEKVQDGWRRLRFAPTEAIPSYLVAFAVGPWDVVDWTPIPPNAVRRHPVALRGLAAKGRGKEFDYALRHTAEVLEALEVYFDSPYPFDKLDLVAAPDFAFGAMENPGLIVYRDTLLLSVDKASAGTQAFFWEVHAHELAHQWFGNLVTMPWWDDIWLNESFANWLAQKIAFQLRPEYHHDRDTVQGGLRAMGGDSLASTRRVREPVHHNRDVMSAFDGITYAKGGMLLSMFEAYLGPEAFRDALRRHMQRFARGNATSRDLILTLTDGHPEATRLQAAFASFVDQPGVPLVHVDLVCAADEARVELRQERYLPLGSTSTAAQRWIIPLCLRYADGDGSRRQCQLLEGAEAEFALDAKTCPAWVMPNADAAGYYRFALAADDQPALAAAFDRLAPLEQRVWADSLVAAFRSGAADVEALMAALPALGGNATMEVSTAPLGTLGWIREYLVTEPAARAAFDARIAAVYRPRLDALGLDARAGDTPEDRWLRGSLIGLFAETLEDAALRDALAERGRRVIDADGKGALAPDAVDPDLRSIALQMAALRGDAATFERILGHALASTDSLLRRQLLGALGRVEDPALAARARALALDDRLQAGEVWLPAGGQFGRDATRPAAREWLAANEAALLQRLPKTSHPRIPAVAASGMCSAEEADMIEARYRERMADVEGGPRGLAQTVENIRLCAAQRAHHLARGGGAAG